MCPEYAGYSLYKDCKPGEERIKKDMHAVMKYVINFLKFDPKDIILVGRSLGSCFALELCRYFFVHSCILISPFASLKNLIIDWFGKIVSMVVKNELNNMVKLEEI